MTWIRLRIEVQIYHRIWKCGKNLSQMSLCAEGFQQIFQNFNIFIEILFLDMQMRAPWTPRPENDSEKVREVSFTLSLTAPMGPKHSAVIETQVKYGILLRKLF